MAYADPASQTPARKPRRAKAVSAPDDDTGEHGATHTYLKRCFETSEHVSTDARTLAERDRDYFDNKQLTTAEHATIVKRGQPPITRPFIKRKINYIIGLEIKKRSDPKAFPRTPKHEQDADSATQALRYVADKANFKKTKTKVAKELFIEGGPTGCYIGVKKAKGGAIDITITGLAWDRAFVDPHSAELDYSDAEYKGFITWMDESAARRRFPAKADVIAETVNAACANTKTYDDRPRSSKWVDTKRKRVRLIEIYWQGDEGWMCAILTESGFLKEPHVSEYIDQDGEPECPIEFVSANVDRENNRYGEVRELIDTQDSLNKRISKLTHLLNVRQARFGRGVKDPDKQSAELAKPDGKIIADKDEFDIIPTGDLAAGNFQILQLDIAESQAAGANASLMGKGPEGASGRAILANQQGGQVELEPLMDELGFWELRVYRQIWNRIRQYWTGETWVRVTDDEQNMKWVGMNTPMTNAQYAEREKMPPEQFAQLVQQGLNPNAPAVDLQTGQPMIANSIAELEVDIIIERGPDTITMEQEQFDTLAKVPGIPPDMLIEASSLRNKDKILERMRGGAGPDGKPLPPPPEVLKAQAEAEERDKDRQLEVQKLVGDRELEREKLELEKMKLQMEMQKMQGDLQLQQAKIALEAQKLQIEGQRLELEQMKMAHEARMNEDARQWDREKHATDTMVHRETAHMAREDKSKAKEAKQAPAVGVQLNEATEKAMVDSLSATGQASADNAKATMELIRVMAAPIEIHKVNGKMRAVRMINQSGRLN